MSTAEQSCGTCAYFILARKNTRNYGECDYPAHLLPTAYAVNIPEQISAFSGTGCPTWTFADNRSE